MRFSKLQTFISGLIAVACMTGQLAATSPADEEAKALLEGESAKQKELVSLAEKDIAAARNAASKGNHKAAIDLLTDTQNNLPVNVSTVDVVRTIQVEKINIALDLVEATKSEENHLVAESLLAEYQELFGKTSEYQTLAKSIQNVLSNPYNHNIRTISPEWSKTQDENQALIIKARAQYLAGDYQGAQLTLKEIESRDSDNVESKGLQVAIAQVLNKQGTLDRAKTKEQLLEEVNRAWQRPQVYEIKVRGNEDTFEINPVIEKIKAISIPKVSFSGVPLSRVVSTLSELSVQYDRTEDEGKKGVNIILLDPGAQDPAVTITLRDFSLERILQFVTKSVNFQYDVQDGAVIVQQGGSEGGLETEFFAISRATVIRLTGIREEVAAIRSENPFEETPAATTGSSALEEEDALKSFFQRAGVNFDGTPGSNIAFDGTQIIVTQTPRNLARLATILRKYDETKQVEIEAKFLEVQEGVLEELGFNWGATYAPGGGAPNPENAKSLGTNGNLRTLAGEFQTAGSTQSDGFVIVGGTGFNIQNTSPTFPGIINLANGAANAASWSTVFGDWQANLTIRALEQHTGSDLLTAPRITVLAGKPASIVVAQRLFYPTSYSDTESEVSAGSGGSGGSGGSAVAITPGTPQDFESENIGVVLDVTPDVEEDDSITLKLNPRVTEFEGFVEYGGRAVAIAGGITANVPTGFFMPVFSVREITTEVTIFDGATVVLGGLTREEVKSIEDSVPLLGDVPLLGRLFRSEGETREKRNLLIFVSANLISPGGSPSKQESRNVRANSLFQNPVIVTPGGAVGRNITEQVITP